MSILQSSALSPCLVVLSFSRRCARVDATKQRSRIPLLCQHVNLPRGLLQVRELIYKRGYGCVNKQRIPITDNSVIKDNLGKYGITCVEDLVHEIATVGPNFKPCNQFLWP